MRFDLFIFQLLTALLLTFSSAHSSTFTPAQQGRILFLIQHGDSKQALKLYQEQVKITNTHDYELLNHMGLALMDYGSKQSDPEIQLLSLFGAQISANSDAYGVFQECLKSRHPQIQLLALGCLSQIQQDQADHAIMHMLGSPYALLRFEALSYLCKKKHPLAMDQLESLMAKSPPEILALYPTFLADLGTAKSMRLLRKMINHPLLEVRQAVILNAAIHHRDDFLPQIRQQALHFHFTQQEICAYALGLFKDEQSIDKLQKLARSQYPATALAANWALYELGEKTALKAIEQQASQGDIFAIHVLGKINEESILLLKLLQHSDLQVRVNAQLALLNHHQTAALVHLDQLLIKDKRDLGFISVKTPGKTFKAWKVTSGVSEAFKNDVRTYQKQLMFKEELLEKVREISEKDFLRLSYAIFAAQQNELVPTVIRLLEEMETPEALACIYKHQQKLGAPLIRNYCNLALYRLNEKGPYADYLKQWIKQQSSANLIQLQEYDPWQTSTLNSDLTPTDTSRLLIESFQAFAMQQDQEGVELLIDVIVTGNEKNKYALAGLLLRAAQ